MFRLLRNFFYPSRPCKPQESQLNPADDRADLRNVHRVSPASTKRRVGAEAESSSRLCKDFWNLALTLRPTFPQTCSWLGLPDLQDIDERPVDGGRFADVWRGRLEGRDVAVKSYRCYVCFDCDQIRMVSYSRRL